MPIVFYVIAATIGLFFSYITFVFSMLGGGKFSLFVGALLVLAHIGTMVFAVKKAKQKNIGIVVLSLVSPAFIALIAAAVFAEAQSLFNTYSPDPKFRAACEHTGVLILNAPTAKVTSIGLDWDPEMGSGPKTVYRMGSGGRLDGFENSIPFPEMIVDKSLADVVVTQEVSDPEEAKMAPLYQKLIRYTLTVTDRRDGLKLATMAFAVDMEKGHACGENVKDAIDLNAFLRKVTTFQGQSGISLSSSVAQEVPLEVLETETYSPVRIMTRDEWSELAWDSKRTKICDELAPKVSPRSLQRRFKSDITGMKRMVPLQAYGEMVCDGDGILSVRYVSAKGGVMLGTCV
jgi:hypothetical protein